MKYFSSEQIKEIRADFLSESFLPTKMNTVRQEKLGGGTIW
jgi:hypothetical protein